VRALRSSLPTSIPIVAAGGIDSETAARRAFEAGADLVQIYTGLLYRGPSLVRELLAAAGQFAPVDVAKVKHASD
jgi:dihydroorotate dehydrogenase